MLHTTISTWELLRLSYHSTKTAIETFITFFFAINTGIITIKVCESSASSPQWVIMDLLKKKILGRDHRWNLVIEQPGQHVRSSGFDLLWGNVQKQGLRRTGHRSFLALPGYKWQGGTLWHQGNHGQIFPEFRRTRKHLGTLITILSKSTGLNTGIQYIDYLKILLTQAKRFAVYLFTLPEILYSVLFRHLCYVWVNYKDEGDHRALCK